jgi:protein-S-isoprenylcysteine O-methyltransferase Ste14
MGRGPWANRLARFRVPLGFLSGALAFWLARPTAQSVAVGMGVALAGEVIRLWAAGHLEKAREITTSGPYRFVRHPLYLGSAVMGLGFILAARSIGSAVIAGVYLGATLTAAIRTEEAALDAGFDGEYAAYREGRHVPVERPFSWSRVQANREPRTVLGLIAAGGLLYLRTIL